MNGRDGQIRTADPSHPKRVLYQAEPRPDTVAVLDSSAGLTLEFYTSGGENRTRHSSGTAFF